MCPIFVFAKCCWSIHSKVVRLGKHAHSKQRKATLTQPLQFHIKCMCMPGSSASIQSIFLTYDLVCSNIRKSLDAEKAKKLVNVYRFYKAEEDNHNNLFKLFKLFFCCSSLSNFVAVRSV